LGWSAEVVGVAADCALATNDIPTNNDKVKINFFMML
jgi:hypothetical protein